MIYCINKISSQDFLDNYCQILCPNDIVVVQLNDLTFLSNSNQSHNQIIQNLQRISFEQSVTILFVFKKNKTTKSVSCLIFEDGQVLSISHPIYDSTQPSNSINFCQSKKGLICCIHGEDIFHTSLWPIYSKYKPRYIFYINSHNTAQSSLTMCKALAIDCNQTILASFNDQTFEISNKGCFSNIQSGRLRTFSSSRQYKK